IRYENPKLGKLQQVLQDQFQELKSSRGIVFTWTRQSAYSLHEWVLGNQALCALGIKSDVLTGVGSSSQTKHMTQQEQQDVIQRFRKGQLNLLFSTSVAEEGLDIPECNIIIRYGLMTNEIAMMQARGRARAPNSICSILAKTNSKEVARERLNETLEILMESAIKWVQDMPEKEYHQKYPTVTRRVNGEVSRENQKITSHLGKTFPLCSNHLQPSPAVQYLTDCCASLYTVPQVSQLMSSIAKLQHEGMISRKLRDIKLEQQRQLHDPDSVLFCCLNCNLAVCRASDLRKIENMHHININPNFSLYYKKSQDCVAISRKFKDWKLGNSISCEKCGQIWGVEMVHRDFILPMLAIKNFVVETPNGRQKTRKWSKVTFEIKAFDYTEYCNITF
uniref:RNA helicase n=1 Tax=Laticauda laticaudata TaxID=8630 RepID=A0A8C5SX60_LATLA